MNEKNIYENKELCSKCGGKCCQISGCDYSVKDFKNLKIDYLEKELKKGYVSIVACQCIKKNNEGKLINEPFLYLRARNVGRPIIDLLSMKTPCMSWNEDTGCMFDFEHRPSGGKNLIPSEKGCYNKDSQLKIVSSWKKYQKLLEILVKRINGNTVEEQIKIDVEKLFYDILNQNFKYVSLQEVSENLDFFPTLVAVYPEEYKKANERIKNEEKIINLTRYKKAIN